MKIDSLNLNSTKTLIKLTIPIFLELILQVLLGNVDKIMVRNDLLANAITQANSIIDLLTITISVLTIGSLILISQYKGAKDFNREKKIYSIAFYFNLSLGILLGIAMLFCGKTILSLMNVSSEFYNDTLTYLYICGGFLFLQSIILTLFSFLRSNAFVMHGLIVSITTNVLNVGLNALFMYVLKIPSIIAVALGTVISRSICSILLLILMFKLTKVKLSIKDALKSSKGEFKKLIKISIPSAGESFSYSLSQIVILTIINIIGLKLNSAAPTAKSYVNIMVQFSFIFTSSVSQAMQIILGRHLGSRNIVESKKVINKTLVFALGSSILISSIQAIFAIPIFSLLTKDVDVINLCAKIMIVEILLEIGRAVNITMVRALQTSGDVIFPTTLAIIFCWGIATIGSYIFGVTFKMGIIGVWVAMTIDELVRALIFIIRFKKEKWTKINLVKC